MSRRNLSPSLMAFIGLAALMALVQPAHAVVAYNVPAGTVGNQAFGGSLGMDFDVTRPVTIESLGVFDSGSNGLSSTINAYLYDRTDTTTPIATLQFTSADPGTLQGGSRFKLLGAPINLPGGFQGTIVAEGYSGAEPLFNQGTMANPGMTTNGADRINFVGGGRFGTAGQFPAFGDGGPANRYAAGTFDFSFLNVAYEIPAPVAGNQAFGGSLGMDFNVNTSISIDQLGVFDSDGDGLMTTITAHIYDRTNTAAPIATLVFAPGEGELIGGSRFKELPAALTLEAGFMGTIVAEGYNSLELNGNSGGAGNFDAMLLNEFDGVLSFVGGSRFGTAGQFPANVDGGPAGRYGAGTFSFNVVPEPASAMLLLMGGMGLIIRRRRQQA